MIGRGEYCRREVKRGRRRRENEASFGEDKEAQPRKENKKKHRAGQLTLSGEVRDLYIWGSRAPETAHAARINYRRHRLPLTVGPTAPKQLDARVCAIITAQQPKGRGAPSRPAPTSPLRAQPRQLKRRAHHAQSQPQLWAFNGLIPYGVSVTPAQPEPRAQKTRPSKGANTDLWLRVPLDDSGSHRCPRIKKITDQQLVGRLGREPTNPADATKMGAPRCHLAMALLIRASKPDLKGFEQAPKSTESGTTRARAFEPNLEPASSRVPHMLCSRANEGS
jgi:hypothetical protein